MKKVFSFFLIALLSISCNQQKIEQQQSIIDSLRVELSNVKQNLNLKDRQIIIFYNTLNDIYDALNRISQSELQLNILSKDIETNKVIITPDRKQEILNMINQIANEFQKNEKRFVDIKNSSANNDEGLKRLVGRLYQTNYEQQIHITELTTTLNEKLFIINNLEGQLTQKDKELYRKDLELSKKDTELSRKDSELSKRYYIVGKKRYLKDYKIIESVGGFLGINSKLQLCQPFPTYRFNVIDKNITYINIGADVDELVPNRLGSYELDGSGANTIIRITNADLFWQIPYLAIVID